MKRKLRPCLSLGLILTGGFTRVERSVAASPGQGSLTITLQVYNYAEVDHKTLMGAEKVAAMIFRKAGVESRWVEAALNSDNKKGNSEDTEWLNLFPVAILPSSMAERLPLADNALGWAPGAGPDRHLVYVLYNRVESLAREQTRAQVKGSIRAHAGAAQILGTAIVHEIGHLLLNLESHSPIGIMRGGWDLNDLRSISYGSLFFTSQQAEVIRAEVGRRLSFSRRTRSGGVPKLPLRIFRD